MAEVRIEREHDGVALVRLMAPDRKNALVGDMARELLAALAEADADDSVGAVVISGGEDAFCAGAHRGLLAAVGAGDDPQAQVDIQAVYAIFDAVRRLRAPSIAAVCGPAVGAGLNLALACGVRLAGDNAFLRSMFVGNDIHPAGGHLRMLRDIGGRSLAVRMAVLDEPLGAAAAVAAGLAIGPYPPADVEAAAIRLARHAAAKPSLARWINGSVDDVIGLTDNAAAQFEAEAQGRSLRQRERAS
ncbi:MAG: Enoyl-CoA hydratase/isomerase [Conexibacter sp.]|jgi:enoyl-CoA hydratase|nr:Enoyl-CoA hydratase/isomerase [Conexibacter sp.]MDX6731246.1 enoyl-CoA hydratase [Baekduia sp.]